MVDWKTRKSWSACGGKDPIEALTMGNDTHVPDVVLVLHQVIYLVCCGSSESWTVAVRGGRIHTDGEVTGNRSGSEQIDDNDEGHGSSTYTMAVNLEDDDD